MIFKMDWKRELIDEYNDNYDKMVTHQLVIKGYSDAGRFEKIDKMEFVKYVSLFDSKQLYDKSDDNFVKYPMTEVTLTKLFVANLLYCDVYHSDKIKLDLFDKYAERMLKKFEMFDGKSICTVEHKTIIRHFSECVICGYKDYVDCYKMFVCCDCAKLCSSSYDEFGIRLKYKHGGIWYEVFGNVKYKDAIGNVHKLIKRCNYLDNDSVVLFVMARDELGLLMDVVKVIVGFVYC